MLKVETLLVIYELHDKNKLILQHVCINILSHFVYTWCVVYKFYILKNKIMIYNQNI